MYTKLIIAVMMLNLILFSVDARMLFVGPSRTYKTPCDVSSIAQSGDTIEIDTGLYLNQACTWSASNTVIRGVSRYAHLKAPEVIPNQKAILVVTGSNTTIENIQFSDARVPDQNGAGIRLEGKNVTIRNCYFHNCEDGILGGSGYVLIEYCEFGYCGFGDGYSHNMYISACDSFTLRYSYTHDANEGHTIKSRAFKNSILYNRIESANSTTSYEVNLPNAGTSFIIGNQIHQGPNSHNSVIIDYGSEGLSGHDSSLYVINNTIVNDRGSGTFISLSNTGKTPKVYNNIFVGNGTICNKQMDSSGNVITNAPFFVDKSTFNYHLTSLSPALNKGTDPGSIFGFDLSPQYEYVSPMSNNRRVSNGIIDAGAYEYVSSGVIFNTTKFAGADLQTNSGKALLPVLNLQGRSTKSSKKSSVLTRRTKP